MITPKGDWDALTLKWAVLITKNRILKTPQDRRSGDNPTWINNLAPNCWREQTATIRREWESGHALQTLNRQGPRHLREARVRAVQHERRPARSRRASQTLVVSTFPNPPTLRPVSHCGFMLADTPAMNSGAFETSLSLPLNINVHDLFLSRLHSMQSVFAYLRLIPRTRFVWCSYNNGVGLKSNHMVAVPNSGFHLYLGLSCMTKIYNC